MNRLTSYLRDCLNMVVKINGLKAKRNKGQNERSELKFVEDCFVLHLKELQKIIENYLNKKED